MNWLEIIDIPSRWLFLLCISYYLITILQWYNYSLKRIITKYHKWKWHWLHFILPTGVFLLFNFWGNIIFYLYLYLIQLPFLVYWTIKLDKRLVLTKRVWRFFVICFTFILFDEILSFVYGHYRPQWRFLYFLPIIFGWIFSRVYEILLLKRYAQITKDKLASMRTLKIIAITGSYGKTSIKNFLYQILQVKYTVYASPRSVNTLKGLISDINKNLDFDTEIYIAEAGARQKGDIKEISSLLHHHYAIIGEIGEQHLEYFKNIQNIASTKFELLESPKLQKVFVYEKNPVPQDLSPQKKSLISPYPKTLRNVSATLEGTSFEMQIQGEWFVFETKILGEFNVANIAAAILTAYALKVPIQSIIKAVSSLRSIPHRLNLFLANGKTIIDDSFNGNLKGMLEAIRLVSLSDKRKIIITPGLVESNESSNIALAKAIDQVFDIAIVTGELNAKILSENIRKPQRIILKDKAHLENILKTSTHQDDLILFANDAPSYI